MRKYISVFLSLPTMLATSLVGLPMTVLANNSPVSTTNNNVSANSTATYWTPEQLRNARPLDLPRANVSPQATSRIITTSREPSVGSGGQPPIVEIRPNQQPIFTPEEAINDDGVTSNNVGTQGAHFTSSRIVPLTADLAYPYRTVGKLFFTKPGVGNFVCSGAVLRPRIILTAGHCVHRGSGSANGFYTNFLFIPAYRDGAVPYQQWAWSRAVVTGSWANGNGNPVNAADFAIIEVADRPVSGVNRRIGDLVGYLGYQTNRLTPNHATLLGYPGNLDSGQKMHQVTAESFGNGGNGTVLYGSDMRGGSSGGPWVQNFGVAAVGQVDGLNRDPNRIIGVTSYGPVAIGPLYQGSSTLNNEFISILNIACGWNSRNCQ